MKIFVVMAVLVLALAACASPAPPATSTPVSVPTVGTATPVPIPTVATATPIILTRPDVQDATRGQVTKCGLVTRTDMGGFYGAEVNQPFYHTGTTNVLPFSNEQVAANEYYCVYNAFHNSGSGSGNTFQTTYWVDQPGQTPAGQWTQVWKDGGAHAAQDISGVGDDAFYNNGRLTFKKGDTYVTIEVLATKMDTDTPAGVAQQIDYEKQVALKALSRWQ